MKYFQLDKTVAKNVFLHLVLFLANRIKFWIDLIMSRTTSDVTSKKVASFEPREQSMDTGVQVCFHDSSKILYTVSCV